MAAARLSSALYRKGVHLCAVGYALFLLLAFIQLSVSFQYKKDTLSEECSNYNAHDCQQSSSLWYSCPVTCSSHFEVGGSMAEVNEDPQAFFELDVQPFEGNHALPLEDYEGYVTAYAVVPMAFPTMAKFYFDMLEHIASIYPFTVQFIFLPLVDNRDEKSSGSPTKVLQTSRYNQPSTTVLEPSTPSHNPPALAYLLHAEIVAGNTQASLWYDRPTIFLVSSDGVYIERLIAPTIIELERRIAVHLLQLETTSEL